MSGGPAAPVAGGLDGAEALDARWRKSPSIRAASSAGPSRRDQSRIPCPVARPRWPSRTRRARASGGRWTRSSNGNRNPEKAAKMSSPPKSADASGPVTASRRRSSPSHREVDRFGRRDAGGPQGERLAKQRELETVPQKAVELPVEDHRRPCRTARTLRTATGARRRARSRARRAPRRAGSAGAGSRSAPPPRARGGRTRASQPARGLAARRRQHRRAAGTRASSRRRSSSLTDMSSGTASTPDRRLRRPRAGSTR